MSKITKNELLAQVAELQAENTAFAAELGIVRVQAIKALNHRVVTHKYLTARVKHDGGVTPHTPGSIDLIRKYYWRHVETMSRKEIVSHLISQGFTPATVRTRISWLYAGIDESCTSPTIRARLGLDPIEGEEAAE